MAIVVLIGLVPALRGTGRQLERTLRGGTASRPVSMSSAAVVMEVALAPMLVEHAWADAFAVQRFCARRHGALCGDGADPCGGGVLAVLTQFVAESTLRAL